jgi:hypothetical protein
VARNVFVWVEWSGGGDGKREEEGGRWKRRDGGKEKWRKEIKKIIISLSHLIKFRAVLVLEQEGKMPWYLH